MLEALSIESWTAQVVTDGAETNRKKKKTYDNRFVPLLSMINSSVTPSEMVGLSKRFR